MEKELLEKIDEVIKTSSDLKSADRYSPARRHKLKKLQRSLREYRDNLTDMLVTIRGMERALEQEILRTQ